MLQIIKTEWLKIKRYPAFWWVMGITALTYPGVNYMTHALYLNVIEKESTAGQIAKVLLGNPFSLPEAWRTVAYFSSLFVFIPAIVVIMLITNEYSYRTNRQNIIDGWSRNNFMLAKLIDVFLLTFIITIYYSVVAFLIGINNMDDDAAGSKWSLAYYIGLFALQTFSQLSLAFVFGFLLRKSFFALATFGFYFIILEPIAVKVLKYKYSNEIGQYFPFEISQKLLPNPAFLRKFDEKSYQAALDAVNPHILYTILLLLITWGFCFWLNNRRDL